MYEVRQYSLMDVMTQEIYMPRKAELLCVSSPSQYQPVPILFAKVDVAEPYVNRRIAIVSAGYTFDDHGASIFVDEIEIYGLVKFVFDCGES